MVDDKLAGGVELLEHGAGGVGFNVAAAAPVDGGVPAYFTAYRQRICAHGAVFAYVIEREARKLRKALKASAGGHGRGAVTLKIRPVLRGDYRKVFVRVVYERAVRIQQAAERVPGEAADAGGERELGVPAADVHGVKLYAAALPYEFERTRIAGEAAFAEQAAVKKEEAARFLPCQRAHPSSLARRAAASMTPSRMKNAKSTRG